jgi:thymidylate synthase ThyX
MKRATLIFDNLTNQLVVPERMGKPREDQLQGTVQENLCELAGRVCFDSLGKGRSSEAYHPNILSMGHTSIYEHANFTVAFKDPFLSAFDWIATWVNRPGVWIETKDWYKDLRVTLNLRSMLEWDKRAWKSELGNSNRVGRLLRTAIAKHLKMLPLEGARHEDDLLASVVDPVSDEEVWVSFFIENVSRALTAELNRHGDRTAISQRSTRYCDEFDSKAVRHPAMGLGGDFCHLLGDELANLYDSVVLKATHKQIASGVSESNAKKQARGAAARCLPLGLETQEVFSASLAQWKHIISMRASEAADAEIMELAKEIDAILRAKFPDRF